MTGSHDVSLFPWYCAIGGWCHVIRKERNKMAANINTLISGASKKRSLLEADMSRS